MTAPLLPGYCLLCPHDHEIPIPRPSRVGTDGNLRGTRTENRKAFFVCPVCGLVSAYYGQDIQELQNVPAQILDPFLENGYVLAAIEARCDDENCKALTRVHIVGGRSAGIWKSMTIDSRSWMCSDTALCDEGHNLLLPSEEFRPEDVSESPF